MNRIYLSLSLAAQLITVSCVNQNEIVPDYFSFRNVKRVVGFSCGTAESDFELVKTLNDMDTAILMINSKSAIGSQVDFRRILSADYQKLGVFVDFRCDNYTFTRIIADATKYAMYDEMHKWLIVDGNLNHSLQILNDNAFSISTDVVIAVQSARDYKLYDVYNPCKGRGGSMNVSIYGSWNSETGLIVSLKESKFQRRSNLQGMKLKVGIAVNYKPENMSVHDMMLEYSMKAKYGRSKFMYIVLLHMADLFNFTMDVVEINTQRRFDNSGPIFTAFKKKVIDISASPVAMKVDRLSYGDIIGPVWPIRSCFMFRTISSTKMKPSQFLKPLSVKVWYVILIMIAIATSILVVLLRLEGISSPTEGYGISVLLTIGALAQQGSVFVPTHYGGRIAFLHIMFFSLLILNYYSASVVSDRLKNIGEKMNDSLISLAKSDLKLAVEPTPYIRSFLQVPDREVKYFYQKRWGKVPESSRYLPLEEGLDRVAEGGLAYHSMIDSAYPYIEHSFKDRSICELTEVHLLQTSLAFYARHKSPFTELMKIGLTKIHNVGILKRQLKRWSARKPFCPSNLLIAEPLSIHEAAPVFIFFCFCTLLALIICLIENFVYWLRPTRLSDTLIEKSQLIGRSINMQALRDVNFQTLRNFNIFKGWSIPSTGSSSS